MKRMHSSGNDDSRISFSSVRRDPFIKHSRRLEGKKKKKENWRIPLAFRRFQLRSRRGKEPLSLLIYLYLMYCFFLVHRIIMHYDRTDIYRCLFTRASKHFRNMQPTENWYEVESRLIFSEDSLRRYSGYQGVVFGSRDLGNSAGKREIYS